MTVTVSVYEKQGLCRGPGIGNATLDAVFGFILVSLTATNGGPLSGMTHVYTVVAPSGSSAWNLRVDAPRFQQWTFFVRDGEVHEVWLSRE